MKGHDMGKFKRTPQPEPKPEPPLSANEPKPETCLNDEGVYLVSENETAKVYHHPVFGPIKVKK